jgi:hypothetical protein
MTGPNGRRALPPETHQVLGYDELIDTLRLLENEQVCLCKTFGESDGKGSRFEVVGTLRHLPYSSAHCFAIGQARLLLRPGDFVEASLWTFDGNDFFQISLRFGDQQLTIGDAGSLATDAVDIT